MTTTLANFVYFTIPEITTQINSNGEEKKQLRDMPKAWTTAITKDNYKNYIKSYHKAFCLPAGEINNITIIDFDDKSSYEYVLNLHPELKNYKTIQTRRGFHIYCKYNPNLHTQTNCLNSISGVDIANDKHMVFAPPTSYYTKNGVLNKYVDLGGEILDIPEFIIQDYKYTSNTKTKTKKIVVKDETETDTESVSVNTDNEQELNEKQELLNIIRINKKDRKTWMRVCACIIYNKMKNEDWLHFCKNNELNMDEEKKHLFKNFINPYPIEMHYLQSLAKQSNHDKYKQWLDKWNIYHIDTNILDEPKKVAETICKTLKETLILCQEKWYMLTEKQLWKQQKEPSYYIINELEKYIDYSNKKLVTRIALSDGEQKDKLIEQSKIYLKSYKNITNPGFLSNLTKFLKTLLVDDDFSKKLDANIGELAFRNGIMDLQTKTFRYGINWDDFITQTIKYDYKKGDEIKKQFVKNKLKEILNNNEEHLEYFLSIVGHTFTGDADKEKSIYFCVDKTDKCAGDNGKTFYFDILTELMPNYVYKTKGTFLEECNTKVHKQLIKMKGMRLVWLDEFSKKKVNAELMKELGDGKKTENEIMHGTSENINILFKLFTLTNHLPTIDPNDTAVYNRYKQISYGSHFDRTGDRVVAEPENLLFIADTTLGDILKNEYYNEIFELIIDYANKYYTNKIPKIPAQFLKDTKETQKNNDNLQKWFDDNCIKDNESREPLQKIINLSGLTEKIIKEGLNRLGFKYDKDLSKMGKHGMTGKSYKGGFVGFKINDCDELDDDDDC